MRLTRLPDPRIGSGPGLPNTSADGGYRSQSGYDDKNSTPHDQRLGLAVCAL